MPGLAGGLMRILNTFLIPIFGTQKVVSISALLKIIPLLMLGFTVMDPSSSYGYFMLIGFLLGIGGGDFSSYMPSTSLFFPKRLSGTALGWGRKLWGKPCTAAFAYRYQPKYLLFLRRRRNCISYR